MGQTRLDTLASTEALQDAGFEPQQSRAIVNVINGVFSESVATKADLAILATKDDLARHAETTREVIEKHEATTQAAIAQCATKDDIKNFVTRDELAKRHAELLERIAATSSANTRWYISFWVAFAGLFLAILAQLPIWGPFA